MCRIFFYLIILLGTQSCINKTEPHKLDVNLNTKHELSIHTIFNNIELIPLETNKECIIGRIGKILLHESNIYVLDTKRNIILTFSNSGNFVRKIGRIGKGPGEYTEILDFEINKSNNIEILTDYPTKILIYNLNGDFIKNKKLPKEASFAVAFKNVSNTKTLLFSRTGNYRVGLYDKKINKFKILKKQIPFYITQKTSYNSTSSPFFVNSDSILFFEVFSNEVYSLNKNELGINYTWDFGDFNFDIYKNMPKNKNRSFYQDFLRTNNYASYFYFNIKYDKYITTSFLFKNELYYLIHDTNNKKNHLFTKFKEGGVFPNFPVNANGFIYSFINAAHLSLLVPESVLNEKNRDISKSVKNTDNPIILKYYYK